MGCGARRHVPGEECHHLSAVGFEAIARAAKARYVLGLSATVTRKDGHHPIIFMQCGPVRQYAGRLHRRYASKRDVVIYDYVDENEPMLMKMATRREAGYRSLGYRPVRSVELALEQPSYERT
jgi:superfamily II DNA or RNA helicase